MSAAKRFHLNDTLSLVSTVLEDCVNGTMVGEAFGVDSGDTWELRCRTSDEVEEYSNRQRWMLDVRGRVTDTLKSDEGELAGGPSVHVLAIEANKINEERTVVDVAFSVDDLREYFNRLLAEIERYWPYVRRLETESAPEAGTALPPGQDRGDTRLEGHPSLGPDQAEGTPKPGSWPSWLPKKRKTLEKWQKTYEITRRLDEEYLLLYEAWTAEEPWPRMEDYREALKSIGIGYSVKRVGQIRTAGQAGWIEERLASLS